MIAVAFNSRSFQKEMNNIVKYSLGFLEGAEIGKTEFLSGIGTNAIEAMKTYIDTMARVDPEMLHQVYEWNQTGNPSARLYDIDYTVSNLGLSLKSSFKQSSSIKNGSNVPFYDKARIMENGIPVTIKPRNAKVLSFDDNGEQVFTKLPVRIENPGGSAVQGGFESAFDNFFKYFSQSFIRSSGIGKYLENPVAYKSNLPAGKRGGKATGIKTGYRWIANAGIIK
jgi:hypothetical protein